MIISRHFHRHGDGHSFYLKKKNNLYDLQVESGESADPISIAILRDPSTGDHSLEIDRRAGSYNGGCKSGNSDVTWG